MFGRASKKRIMWLISAAMVTALVGGFIVPMAFAKVALNTIDPLAVVTDHGRHIILTGPISCTTSERAYVQVTVTQRATGAMAEGRTVIPCTPATQQWQVHASTRGSESFQEGRATAVALARTSERGEISDAHQWLVGITLVRE